jgi:hypothetical protein
MEGGHRRQRELIAVASASEWTVVYRTLVLLLVG